MEMTNAPTFTDSIRSALSVHAEFDITNEFSLTYSLGHSWSEDGGATDLDGSNRIGGYAGTQWWVDEWANFREDPRQVDSVTGVGVLDSRQRTRYTVNQSSHELVLRSNLDGPFNFLVGVFYYQNETAANSPRDDYVGRTRFNDNGVEWDNLRLSSAPMQTWLDNYAAYLAQNFGYDPDTAEFGVDGGLGIAPGGKGACDTAARFFTEKYYPKAMTTAKDWFIECDYRTDRLQQTSYVNAAVSETRAAFVHGTYQIGNWTLSGGARYTTDLKRQRTVKVDFLADMTDVILYGTYDTAHDQKPDWAKWIWEASAEYVPGGNTMYYGRVATGYRAGKFTDLLEEVDFTPPQVKEETLINYEIGVKTQALDQRLTFTSSLFYSEYDDMQRNLEQNYPLGASISDLNQSPLVEYTANIPTSKLFGFEAEFTYYLGERWRFSGYYVYFDSELGKHESVTPGDPNPTLRDWDYLVIAAEDYDFNVDEPAYELLEWDRSVRPRVAVPVLDSNGDKILCSGGAGDCYSTVKYIAMTDQTGNTLPKQPHHKFALTASYTHPLAWEQREIGSLTLLSTYSLMGARHPYIANLPSQEMRAYGGGSARVMLIYRQVEQTLKQFATVREVVIAIEGETEAVLEP